ncbi:MAG: hypothetical protein GY854_26260 [Deltaproteobacteria bacterium]|nr:hypothetical protein [Deltaproteobacteria bacterium]
MSSSITVCAYYYPGWHPCPVRDAAFASNWSEWDLVEKCRPRFTGHEQPNLPLWGRQDESKPHHFAKKIETARSYGIDAFQFAFYWSRGKRLLEGALDRGLIGAPNKNDIEFAVMWANRMPRRVLPVKDPVAQTIDPNRLVHTDPDDFLAFIKHVARRYFVQENYFRVRGGNYLSIFDTNFFIRQLGEELVVRAIEQAREWLEVNGFGSLHLAAIDPIDEFRKKLHLLDFDSATNYVLLPEWKGALLQDYLEMADKRATEWEKLAQGAHVPYFPSVSPGWDASPRALDYGKEKPKRYPWSPVVTERSPELFGDHLKQAVRFSRARHEDDALVFISSWNEWSEGHYLEPDEKHGDAWLRAVLNARQI